MSRSCLSRLALCGSFAWMRLHLCVLAMLVGLSGGAVVLVADSEPVSAADDEEATDYCEIAADQPSVNVVMLLDASRSLEKTDPQDSRRDGLRAAITNLAALARNNPKVDISVAVDTFATRYQERYGWLNAVEAQQALVGQYGNITTLGRGRAGQFTDYGQAMNGVANRLRAAPLSDCNLLLWFTDGEHATEGTSSDISEREWQQLRDLCESPEMRDLKARNLYTVGVLLASPDQPDNSGPLRHLFGERPKDEGCTHELNGQISDDVNADALRDVLDELINELVYEVTTEESDLPNEPGGLPDDSEFHECASGDGTQESPCVFSFPLDPDHESFRVFVDMTFLGREISNPADVSFRLQSPSGERSNPVVAAAQIEEADANPYQPVLPFWFLSRRPYDSRWEIIGHQAAERLASAGNWEWDGEWKLLFWGDTDEASADARKVAAAVRTVTVDKPLAKDMKLNEAGTLIGFVENYPSDDYSSVELNLEPKDSPGEPIYSTRQYLKCKAQGACNPVPVSDDERRFEVARLFEEIVWWDSEEAGGNGEELQDAVVDRGPVLLEAVLSYEFHYGGINGYGADGERGKPLRWVRDIGRLSLDDLSGYLSGEREWQELSEWVESGEPPALPFDIELVSPPQEVSGDAVTFEVNVQPGHLPGVITVDGASKLIGAEISPVGYNTNANWSCGVPDKKEHPGGSFGNCDPIEVDLGLSEDSEVTVTLDFSIAPDPDLENLAFPASMTVPSPQEREELWREIERVARPRSELVESEPFLVDIATAGDKLAKFLPLLVVLVVLAALARLFVAWRLRPWHKLDNAEYVTKRLSLGDDSERASNEELEVDSCMALTARSAKGALADVTVSSSWLPLLAGGAPRLWATSTRGACIGPRGSHHSKGGQIGIIGPDLSGGWVVTTDGVEYRLVVWDFDDEADRSARIAEVEEIATEKLKRMRSNTQASDHDPDQKDDQPNTARDPFADSSDSDSSDSDSSDSDPFGDSSDPFDFPEDPFTKPSDPFQ